VTKLERVKEIYQVIKFFEENVRILADGYIRYEKLRRLSPRQFKDLFDKCTLSGQRFDDAVDKLEV